MSQPKPDPTEISLRFGCGFSFGVVVGSIFIMRQVHAMGGTEWAYVAGIAIILVSLLCSAETIFGMPFLNGCDIRAVFS